MSHSKWESCKQELDFAVQTMRVRDVRDREGETYGGEAGRRGETSARRYPERERTTLTARARLTRAQESRPEFGEGAPPPQHRAGPYFRPKHSYTADTGIVGSPVPVGDRRCVTVGLTLTTICRKEMIR